MPCVLGMGDPLSTCDLSGHGHEFTGTENVFTGGGRGIYTGGQVHRLY